MKVVDFLNNVNNNVFSVDAVVDPNSNADAPSVLYVISNGDKVIGNYKNSAEVNSVINLLTPISDTEIVVPETPVADNEAVVQTIVDAMNTYIEENPELLEDEEVEDDEVEVEEVEVEEVEEVEEPEEETLPSNE